MTNGFRAPISSARMILAVILAIGGAHVGLACLGTIPKGKGPPPAPTSGCDRCKCTGSPCYVSSGSFIESKADLSIPTAGLPIAMVRSYDSSLPVDGPMGVGWTSSLTARLFYATYLFSAPSTYQIEADLTLEDGRRYRFLANADGVSFTSPTGRYDTLVKNADGSFDFTPQRTRRKLHFGNTGLLVYASDEYGNTLNYVYDANGRLQQVSDASGSGRYVNVFFGPNGRISSLQDSAGRQVQYAYNSNGTLASVTDAANRVTTYVYTLTGTGNLLSQISDGFGRSAMAVAYGTDCHTQSTTTPSDIETYTYGVGVLNQTEKWASGSDNRWRYTFNAAGQITDRMRLYATSDISGPLHHTDYYADGSIQQTIDEVGVKTFYTYTATGNIATVTRDYQGPLAIRFDYAYDPAFPDNVVSITPKTPATGIVNPDWQAWSYDYYQAGSPAPGALFHVYRIRSDATQDTIATYVYDSHGRRTRATDAMGGVTDYAYDAQGNLFTVTAPTNNDSGIRPVTQYGYDLAGRVTMVTDAVGHATTYTYDGADRVATLTLPKPTPGSPLTFTTTYSYDNWDAASGLTFTNVTDPNGLVTKQGYDAAGRLVQSIDALNNVTTYAYTHGDLSSIRDANGNVTTYTYDLLTHNLLRTDFPDGALETYTYYADGLLNVYNSRSGARTNAYDSLKRLVNRNLGIPFSAYTYTGQKLSQVDDYIGGGVTETHTFSYDTAYRVTTETQGGRGVILRSFDAADRVGSYTVQSGPTSTYTYYPDGSLNTIVWTPVAGQFKYAYTLAGRYQQIALPNGQTRNFVYDDQGRLTSLSNLGSGSVNLATYAYGYDLNYTTGANTMLGQRVSMTATVPAQGLSASLFKYEYDPLYQLAKATYPNVAPFNGEIDSWTYDAIGNRLTNTVNGATQTYAYFKVPGNPNNWQRLTSDGVNSYAYTVSSAVVSQRAGPGGTFNFTPDAEGRITGITGGVTAAYGYDYQGRRSKKTVTGAASTHLYEGLNLVREAGAAPAEYVFGPGIDEPLAMSRAGQVYYYGTDALGSVAIVTNATAVVQNTYLYDVWGQTRNQTGSLGNPFLYTGREQAEAGTLFYRARFYLTSTGRFLSEDPLTQFISKSLPESGISLRSDPYLYGSGDPTFQRDPLGLRPCGDYPQQPSGGCSGAVCAAQAAHQLCILHNAHSGLTVTHLAVGGAMAFAGFCVGKLPGAFVGEAAGLFLGELLDRAVVRFGENAIQRGYERCVDDCKKFKCMMGAPGPPSQCSRPRL